MNLQEFKFPEVTNIDVAFPTQTTIPELLTEAKERGFYDGRTPYNDLFSDLFFKGGTVKFRTDVDESFRKSAWLYLRAFIGSWAPKYEEKEAICALILSEICEPELQK